MSYTNKIDNYQGDCEVLLGKYPLFSDYIKDFAKRQVGNGLDIGAGPKGCNGAFFKHCKSLDGCDVNQDVVNSLPIPVYKKTFMYKAGSDDLLPYMDGSKEFVVCSCMIQHLNSFREFNVVMKEISRVLSEGGELFLMFKAGSNDTLLNHFNTHYGEQRSFRVFEPRYVLDLCRRHGLESVSQDILLDENWIPYCCLVFRKEPMDYIIDL